MALEDDPGAKKAISLLRTHLTNQDRLVWAPLETLLDVADRVPDLAE